MYHKIIISIHIHMDEKRDSKSRQEQKRKHERLEEQTRTEAQARETQRADKNRSASTRDSKSKGQTSKESKQNKKMQEKHFACVKISLLRVAFDFLSWLLSLSSFMMATTGTPNTTIYPLKPTKTTTNSRVALWENSPPPSLLPSPLLSPSSSLNSGRVKHHAHGPPNRLRRQVSPKLSADHSVSAVRPDHLPPNRAVLSIVLQRLGLVNVGHALAQVKADVLLLVQAFDLDQGGVVGLLTEAALVPEHDTLHI